MLTRKTYRRTDTGYALDGDSAFITYNSIRNLFHTNWQQLSNPDAGDEDPLYLLFPNFPTKYTEYENGEPFTLNYIYSSYPNGAPYKIETVDPDNPEYKEVSLLKYKRW